MHTNDDKKPGTGVITAEGIAPALDLVMDKGLDWVPFLGPAIGAVKAYKEVRLSLGERKQQAFLRGLGTHSPEEIAQFVEQLGDSIEERRKTGTTLMMMLDQFTDFDKCELLGKLTIACGLKVINSSELRRLANAVSLAFPEDLLAFISADDQPVFTNDPDYFVHLQLTGLTQNNGGYDGGMPAITPLGAKLREALNAVRARYPES